MKRTPEHITQPSSKNANSTMASVVVRRRGLEPLRRGHLWIYREQVGQPTSGKPLEGRIVAIVDEAGQRVGCGIFDASSPIAIRVWSTDPRTQLDHTLFRKRLESAIAIRERLFAGGATTAYRLLNGEGDRTPGFVLDRYDDVAILRIDGDAARDVADALLRDVEAPLRAAGITTLIERSGGRGEAPSLRARFGEIREKVTVKEHGVPFVVDLVHGQKTGAFLDQRENRRRIGSLVARRGGGTRVLNLFSYTGGFSLRAALAGGAVTSVDVAMAAHATAQESFRLAGVEPRGHGFVTADCFAFLESAKKRGERWDVVISDPPSFAPSEKAKPKAIAAYRALHRACVEVLAPGGTFVAASCSSHIDAETFLATLDDTALGREDLRVLEAFGPPADHPTLATMPEARYLKLAILE